MYHNVAHRRYHWGCTQIVQWRSTNPVQWRSTQTVPHRSTQTVPWRSTQTIPRRSTHIANDVARRLYHDVAHRMYHDGSHRLYHDVAHRLFHNVLSSKTSHSLTAYVSYHFSHSRNKNRALNAQNVTKLTNSRQHYMQKFHPNRNISAECTYRNSFTHSYKVQFSLRRCRRYSLPLTITLWTSSVTNLTQVAQWMPKALAVIHLCNYVEYGSHFTEVLAACVCSVELHRDLLYWVQSKLCKSV